MNKPDISFVIPLYNEEASFGFLENRMKKLLETATQSIEVILVDDGSKDMTGVLIKKLTHTDNRFKGVILSRNFGHQIAVSAGMQYATCEKAIMIIDGDLQDPPELYEKFYEKINEGFDVVFGIRRKRKENLVKKTAYWSFYRLLKKISNTEIPLDSGDFCMISKRVNEILINMPERSRFIRGIRSWVGFNQIGVEYERDARVAGEPKYDFKKLFKLAYDGIFNFSETPLKLITQLGMVTTFFSAIYIIFIITKKLLGHDIPQGFTTTMVVIMLLSGVQLISIGVLGEYIARIYVQVKERPLFVVKELLNLYTQSTNQK